MFTSGNKEIYDLFLERLNENSLGIEFSGNFIFKFWQQGGGINEFEIIYKSEEKQDLNYLTKEVVPVVDIQTIEIPYVEKNNRSDFEKELYVAIRIEYDVNEFNQRVIEFNDNNNMYQALLETLESIRNTLTYNYNGYKYTFKVKEPQKVNIFKYNGNYYQIFALNFNVSRVEKGVYGNEFSFYLSALNQPIDETHLLDVYESSLIVGKNTFSNNDITFVATDQETNITSRSFQAQLTVNFRGLDYIPDELLFKELMTNDNTTIVKPYNFRMSYNGQNYDKTVYVTSLNSVFRNNSIQQITFQLERV